MQLRDLLEGFVNITVWGNTQCEVCDIIYDSRQVVPGALFCAIRGYTSDGNQFVSMACERGAVAILSEDAPVEDCATVWIQTDNVRQFMALLSARFWGLYGEAHKNLCVVAVTGTNGKTTVAFLIHQLFSRICGEESSWFTGTVGNCIAGTMIETSRTTPEAVDLIRMIGTAPVAPKTLTMEASSHALMLERLSAFNFDIAIFTNLTQEHLDFHETMEAYYQAKKRLFTERLKDTGIAVVNTDDAYGRRLFEECSAIKNIVSCGRKSDAIYQICEAHSDWNGLFFRLRTPEGCMLKFRSHLFGSFNVINCAEAVVALLAFGIEPETLQVGLNEVTSVPGRMSRVSLPHANYTVVVDYAHTPDALRCVLETSRKLTSGRLIIVFGAGGDRDTSKRAPMADVVARNSDYAIITSDNPRSESPRAISDDIEKGMPLDFPYEVVLDRRDALSRALSMGRSGDTILIAGKGHETYQEIAGKTYPFDDSAIVQSLWETLRGNTNEK